MRRIDAYRESFPNARLTRSKTGVLEVALHTDSGTLAVEWPSFGDVADPGDTR